jgi:hypothetical protein
MSSLFSPDDLISAYSRSDALSDGVLVDLTSLVPDEPTFGQQAGWKFPIAFTAAVAALIVPTDEETHDGQDLKGRAWDVLNVSAFTRRLRRPTGDTLRFPCTFWCSGRGGRRGQRTYALKVVIGPGDTMEPVLTFMLADES